MIIPACWCVHDDHWFLGPSIDSFAPAGPATVLVSRTAWDGSDGCWERSAEVAEAHRAEVVIGDWASEDSHRRFALQMMKDRGHGHIFIPDGDEVIERRLLDTILRIAEADAAKAIRVHMATYWKSPNYVIRPAEQIAPIILLDARVAVHSHIREYEATPQIVLSADHGVLHHLSYAGPDARIQRKLSTWGHRSEVGADWYRGVWLGWDSNPMMRDLHPTHPPCYGFAERIETPVPLLSAWNDRPLAGDPELPKNWPKVSVIIPLYGGPEDIRTCLDSLKASTDLIHEIIVVDDKSPDSAPEVVRQELSNVPCLRLLENEANIGFAGTCNRGYAQSTGEVALFLNSDTSVPRAGLIRLIESLCSSATVGAAGPLTNNAGYFQGIEPTYTDLSRLNLFAEDFADRDADDLEVNMLVGFCLAVKRSVLDELGEQPFDERFGKGLAEDTDLCYRLLRAGFRLKVASRSFVHHKGSQSLARMDVHPHVLLKQNLAKFHAKWSEDLASGFASHLSGQAAEPIVFREDRRPDRLRRRLKELARQADISLCMIVRDEAKVLGACLESAKDIFTQIVIVDTGSTDATIEIARSHGAEVHEMEWPDSFSVARNESLKHARGKFIFWVDADDTIPRATAEAILHAAINAPPRVIGFVVPVQFVEEGVSSGTRVDHVKLFRNLSGHTKTGQPRLQFKFRIHEQILFSLREAGGDIARIEYPVLHAHYDTSEAGQKKKRIRDWPLLLKDLEENPEHPFVLFNCGMTAHHELNHEVAEDYLSRSIAASEPNESHLRKAYALLGMSKRLRGDAAAALETLLEGIKAAPDDPELMFQAAITYDQLGMLDDAYRMYLGVRPATDGHFSSIDIAITGWKRSFNLGGVCLRQGKYQEAREWLRQAAKEAPERVDAARLLFDAALDFGDTREALACAEIVHSVLGTGEEWATMRVRIAEAMREPAGDLLHRLARENPYALGPRLLIVRDCLARGDEMSAKPILEALAATGCAEAAFLRGVLAVRHGDYVTAHRFTLHAHQMNPAHEGTKEQLQKLEELLSAPPSSAVTSPGATPAPAVQTQAIRGRKARRSKKSDTRTPSQSRSEGVTDA